MKVRQKILDTTVLFFLVFSFYIAGPIQSSILVGGISFLYLCASSKKMRVFLSLLCSDFGQTLFIGYLALFSFNLLFCIAHGTFDTSYFLSFAMQFIKIICVCMTVAVLDIKGKDTVYYEKLFVAVTVVQALIQIAAFINKPFANIILYFNHSEELYAEYGGRRGLALSGGTGWPLAIVYGISFLFYTKNYISEKKKITTFDVGIGVILLLGVLFSGRTAYLGIIISILFFLRTRCSITSKVFVIFRFAILLFFSSIVILGILYFCAKNVMDTFINYVLPWAFEFFYKKAESGSLSTGSTDVLMEMWKKVSLITERTLLVGDGWYTDPIDGKYFHHVDVGYLRNIFYWGLFGSVFLYVFYIALFVPLYFHSNKNKRLFIRVLVLMMFIMELKAMTVFTAHLATTMVVFWQLIDKRFSLQEKSADYA